MASPANPRSAARGEAKTSGDVVSVKKEEATTVAAANSKRTSLALTNFGENSIFVFKGSGAVVNKGILLAKASPPFVITDYTGLVTASALVGATNLGVCEV